MNAFYLLIKEWLFVMILLLCFIGLCTFGLWLFAKVTYQMHIKKLNKNK